MSGHMSLSAWLRELIVEDRKAVHAAESACIHIEACDDGYERFGELYTPDRLLLECAGREGLVWVHSTPHTIVDGWCVECGGDCTHRSEDDCILCGSAFTPCQSLRLLTMGLTERPGFREEWRAFSDRPAAPTGGQP